jgi:hypothetical protein
MTWLGVGLSLSVLKNSPHQKKNKKILKILGINLLSLYLCATKQEI